MSSGLQYLSVAEVVPLTWDFQLQEPINPTHPHFYVVA